ncbi:MAG: methylated-DNA--[protein]-cysteine S-methyltransferase [Planctomycetota bacterium]
MLSADLDASPRRRYDGGVAKEHTYAVWPAAWGPMGAVAVDGYVSRIVLPHYRPDQLEDLLRWEHPDARRDDEPFAELIARSREYFNARAVAFDAVQCQLPGAFAGTVLRACREIAYGHTVSYSQLARNVGREDAARAVAAALGKNPLPLVIPCHRVIYADGRLGGFSAEGGTDLKQRMLDLESRSGRA